MYICLCKGITDKHIRNEVANGSDNMRSICSKLGVASQCGKCGNHAKQVFKQTINQIRLQSASPEGSSN